MARETKEKNINFWSPNKKLLNDKSVTKRRDIHFVWFFILFLKEGKIFNFQNLVRMKTHHTRTRSIKIAKKTVLGEIHNHEYLTFFQKLNRSQITGDTVNKGQANQKSADRRNCNR